MNPLVSVVMPVYNGGLYLEEAIESILNQTYRDFEFIIINDGSTDRSLEVIERYANQDDRIVVINRKNKGLVYTLNEGIDKAKGKYIARMDADDISLPIRFEKQVKYMETENIDICGSHYFLINESGNIDGLNLSPLSNETCFITLVSKVPFAHPSVMIRKSCLADNNLQYGQSKYKKAEDFDLWIRMYEKGAKFGNVNDILFKYRVVTNSLSKRAGQDIRKESKSMRKLFLKKYQYQLIDTALRIDERQFNSIEKENFLRLILRLGLRNFHWGIFKKLNTTDKKNIVCTILSELVYCII